MLPFLPLLILTLPPAFSRLAQAILLPSPNQAHAFKTAVSHFPLTNPTTKDPYDSRFNRSIMASLFLPIPRDSCTRECNTAYMPDQTARISDQQFLLHATSPVFSTLQYSVCCGAAAPIDASKVSVVVLEPQTDTSRLLYSNMARFISANGVAVLLLDHTGESSITEFTGTGSGTGAIATPSGGSIGRDTVYNSGTVSLSNFSQLTEWNNTVAKAVSTRISDIEFALAELSNLRLLQRCFPDLHFSSPLATTSFSVIGHGVGGSVATALAFAAKGKRRYEVGFSINLSGSPPALSFLAEQNTQTSPTSPTTTTPIYFLSRTNFNRTNAFGWQETWPRLIGPATEFNLANSDMFDFSDLPVVVELAQSQTQSHGNAAIAGRGLAGGSTANHAMLCFAEAVVRKEVWGDGAPLRQCVGMFEGMVPFLGGQAVVHGGRVGSGAGRVRVGGWLRGWW
ncbi:hypothetical protein J1614_006810 [Plenodomus biglobosus]|nr:hypothetical protein J1614_006810 [Plenodomus biglobosus]